MSVKDNGSISSGNSKGATMAWASNPTMYRRERDWGNPWRRVLRTREETW